MNCPRCQQGSIIKVRIVFNGEIVSLCDECDALWPEDHSITNINFFDFGEYVEKYGLSGRWDEIEILEDNKQTS
jgi:hypothetical protein